MTYLKIKKADGSWDIIGGNPVELDDTLTQSDFAADAKAVGDAIVEVKNSTVSYAEIQDLTEDEKFQARSNLGVYAQDDEPTDAEIGTLWIDTSSEGSLGGGGSSVSIDTTLTQAGMAADAKAVGDKFAEVNETIKGLATEEYVDTQINAIPDSTALYVIVEETDEGFIADKTFNEISEAFQQHRSIYAILSVLDGLILPFVGITGEGAGLFVINSGAQAILLTIDQNNNVEIEEDNLTNYIERNPLNINLINADDSITTMPYDGSEQKEITIPTVEKLELTLSKVIEQAKVFANWDNISNKPFETIEGETVLPLTKVEYIPDPPDNTDYAADLPEFDIIKDEVYQITFNGKNYNCVGQDVFGFIALGNLHIIAPEIPDTGEPFIIAKGLDKINAIKIVRSLEATTTEITVSIKKLDKIKYLDNKYLDFLYEENSYNTIFPLTELTVDENGEGYITEPLSLLKETFYNITINGNSYTCQSTEFDADGISYLALGNLAFVNDELFENTGEPFILLSLPEPLGGEIYGMLAVPGFGSNVTLQIDEIETNYQLKDSVLSTEIPVIKNASAGQVVSVKAVDENGKPTEWEAVSASGNVDLSGYATEEYVQEQISSIPTPDVSGQIIAHNTSTEAHNDIRELITGLTTRLNTLANSDDITLDQMAEVVAYIKSNRSLIESVTTNKVNVSDIINNLTTNVTNKPLSAAQGVALKALIDAITVPTKLSDLTTDATHRLVTDAEKATWNAKSSFSGNYKDLNNKPSIPSNLLNGTSFGSLRTHGSKVENEDYSLGYCAFAEGGFTIASGDSSHAEGNNTIASGNMSHAEGSSTIASGNRSHAEGSSTTASGNYSHAEGESTIAFGDYSHAEGRYVAAIGTGSHAEGLSIEYFCHVTGEANALTYTCDINCKSFIGGTIRLLNSTLLAQIISVDDTGYIITVSKTLSETAVSNIDTRIVYFAAIGDYSHTEGYHTTASGDYSHAEGESTHVIGQGAHAEGYHTTASGDYSHVQGKYNRKDADNLYAHIVGNGTLGLNGESNAHTLDWDGNAWFSGDVYVGSTSGVNKDEGSQKLATEEYVDSQDGKNLLTENTVNLLNPDTCTNDYIIEKNGLVATANYSCSDYIEVDGSKTYSFRGKYGGGVQIVLYDENKNCIAQCYENQVTSGSYSAGHLTLDLSANYSNTKYVRVNMATAAIGSVYMIVEGSEYPAEYIPFVKKQFKNEDIKEVINEMISDSQMLQIGEEVVIADTVQQSISIGNEAGGGQGNAAIAIGTGALKYLADNDGTDNGRFNTAIGHQAMREATTADHSTAVGYQAMRSCTTGDYNTAVGEDAAMVIGAGSRNVAVGCRAMQSQTAGDDNVAVGAMARYFDMANKPTGSRNTAVGARAGDAGGAGSDCVHIGYGAKNFTAGLNNTIVIGANARATKENQTVIGNESTVETVIRGNVLVKNSDDSDAKQVVATAPVETSDAGKFLQVQEDGSWGAVELDGIVLKSENKKFRLTINDEGVLSATEIV